jgi:hypothetical protein
MGSRTLAGLLPALCPLTFLFFSSGCATFSFEGKARTLKANETQIAAAGDVEVQQVQSGSTTRYAPVIGTAVGMHYGITDTLEADFATNLTFADAALKVQLLRSPSSSSGLDVAIAPGIGGHWWGYYDFDAHVSALFGVNLPGKHELIVTPRGVWDPIFRYYEAGGSIGFAWQATDRAILVPQINVMYLHGYGTGPSVSYGALSGDISGIVIGIGLGGLITPPWSADIPSDEGDSNSDSGSNGSSNSSGSNSDFER